MLYLFDGGELSPEATAEISLQPEELSTFDFVPPEAIAQRTIPRLARRILAAVDARQAAVPVYLEHGQVPGSEAA